MRNPVTMKLRLEDDLRTRFKEAAWRSRRPPAEVLRQLMERYAELAEDHHTVDMTVWTNIRRAVDGVTWSQDGTLPPRAGPICRE